MRIKPEDYDALRKAIREKAHSCGWSITTIREWYVLAGRTRTMFLWDLFVHTCGDTPLLKKLYSYLKDVHVETALRSIVKELEAEESGIQT